MTTSARYDERRIIEMAFQNESERDKSFNDVASSLRNIGFVGTLYAYTDTSDPMILIEF